MLIVDGHLDLAWNALQWGRDLRRSVYTIRAHEHGFVGPGRGQGTVALPELRKGGVAVCFATVLARATGCPVPNLDFRSAAQAHGIAQGQLAYYRALAHDGLLRIITDVETLDRHWAEWSHWDAALTDSTTPADLASPPLGIVLSMEGADPILDPSQLAQWWEQGLRVMGLVHYGEGRYGGGTGSELGLQPAGLHMLKEAERLGIILDLSHLSDPAFWEALSHFNGAVIASHNNCRALVPHQRQFSDAQLHAIFERDGVVGVACDAWMLKLGWTTGHTPPESVSLSDVADHIDCLCQIAGNSRHAAIGSDLDGGFGREQCPHDLDTIADLQALGEILQMRGYSDADIAAIMHGNWLRVLRQSWCPDA